MGDDWGNHQIFVGDEEPAVAMERLEARLEEHLLGAGYVRVSGEGGEDVRSLAVVPHGRWLHVGDSFDMPCGGEAEADEPLLLLARAISDLWPVVTVEMSDSIILTLRLHRDGGEADRFRNGRIGDYFGFADAGERARFAGRPLAWRELLVPGRSVADLGYRWGQERRATEILADCVELFGWRAELAGLSWFIYFDGSPRPYRSHLDEEVLESLAVRELHFRQPADRTINQERIRSLDESLISARSRVAECLLGILDVSALARHILELPCQGARSGAPRISGWIRLVERITETVASVATRGSSAVDSCEVRQLAAWLEGREDFEGERICLPRSHGFQATPVELAGGLADLAREVGAGSGGEERVVRALERSGEVLVSVLRGATSWNSEPAAVVEALREVVEARESLCAGRSTQLEAVRRARAALDALRSCGSGGCCGSIV